MADESTRVVLVKPGDVLIFGNVGEIPSGDATAILEGLRRVTGVARVLLFTEDIDMAAVPNA